MLRRYTEAVREANVGEGAPVTDSFNAAKAAAGGSGRKAGGRRKLDPGLKESTTRFQSSKRT